MEPNVPAPTPISGGDDPISKSALVRGIVSVCVCWLPIGSIIGIIFGISALKGPRRGARPSRPRGAPCAERALRWPVRSAASLASLAEAS